MDDSWSADVDEDWEKEGHPGVPRTPGRHLDDSTDSGDLLMLRVEEEEVEELMGTAEERARMKKKKKNMKRREKLKKRKVKREGL